MSGKTRTLALTTGPEEVAVYCEKGALFAYVYETPSTDKKRKTPVKSYVVTESVTGQTLRVVSFRKGATARMFVSQYGKTLLVSAALADYMKGETTGPNMTELHRITTRLRQHENESTR
jgi:hypothetical protein